MKLLLVFLIVGCSDLPSAQERAQQFDPKARCVSVYRGLFCQIHGVGHWCDRLDCVPTVTVPTERPCK